MLAEYNIYSHYQLISIMKEYNWDLNELETLTPMELSVYKNLLIKELRDKKERAKKQAEQ